MYSLRVGQSVRISYWVMPLCMLFVVGGVIQYASLLSPTQTNLLVLALFCPLLLLRGTRTELRHELPLIVLAAYAVFVGLARSTSLAAVATYLYYIICTVIAAVSARAICSGAISRMGLDYVQRLFVRTSKVFLLLQVAVCFMQSIFADQVVAHAPMAILLEDAVSGTMFLKSDASLSAITELLIVAVFIIPSSMRDKVAVSVLGLTVIYLGGSKAAQAVVLLVVLLISIRHFYIRLGLNRSGLKYLAIPALAITTLLLYDVGERVVLDFVDNAVHAYERRGSWITADRLAPIGQLFGEGMKVIGDGPLTYYNPLTKSWLYNAGFSTFYSLYIDLGVIGLLLYVIYYGRLIWVSTRNILVFSVVAAIAASFSAFNLILSDLAFAFTINFVLRLYLQSRREMAYMECSK